MPYLIGRCPPQLCLSVVSPFVEYSICVITCNIVTRKLNEYGHMSWKTKSDYVLTLNILGHQNLFSYVLFGSVTKSFLCSLKMC